MKLKTAYKGKPLQSNIDHAFHWIELPVWFFTIGSLIDLFTAMFFLREPFWYPPLIAAALGYAISAIIYIYCPRLTDQA